MFNGFESIQTMGKDNMDFALQSAEAVAKGFHAIAAEATDYSKRSLEANTSILEKLAAAQSVDQAVEAQSEFVRTAYEGYVAQVTKVGEIVTDMAQSAYRPYEAFFGKFGR